MDKAAFEERDGGYRENVSEPDIIEYAQDKGRKQGRDEVISSLKELVGELEKDAESLTVPSFTDERTEGRRDTFLDSAARIQSIIKKFTGGGG